MISKTNVFSAASSKDNLQLSTLIQLLRERADRQSAQSGYIFLSDGETNEETLSYQMLDKQARNIASHLQSMGADGGRVLLLYPQGLEYIAAFFGCLYAGAIAVPAYPPRVSQSLQRLQAIVADAQPVVALTNSAILSKSDAILAYSPELRATKWLATDALTSDWSDQWQEPREIDDRSIAFLQYTSGSTSNPKGVMVSHGNLLHNERFIRSAFGQSEDSVIVGWLPLYHDMGLIGNVLQPLYLGARCILMSPLAFLQSPFRWLSAISRYKATTSGGPNFAYDLCVRRINEEQRASLDLSSWKVAFNGAEPVRADTLENFSRTFQSCGFRKQAFHACYGLAESTLLVCAKPYENDSAVRFFESESLKNKQVAESFANDENVSPLVNCGSSLQEQDIVIVDPETLKRCEPNQIGEIWLAGPSVAHGYWRRPEENKNVFNASTSDTDEGPYLRTGDLGFLFEGELFVTGRLKDLIIIRGLNHYPQDIEYTAENSHEALRVGCGAAFSIDVEGNERLVIVQEMNTRRLLEATTIFEKMRQAVAQQHEIQPYAIVLLKPGGIPKTSSGKIQRSACQKQFLEHSLQAITQWQDTEATDDQSEAPSVPDSALLSNEPEIQKWLVEQLGGKLGINSANININDSMTHYGLDSLAAIELIHIIESSLGLALPVSNFLADLSIAQLAGQLQSLLKESQPSRIKPIHSLPRELTVSQPLSYGQRTLWFLHQYAPESPAYNIAASLRMTGDLDKEALHRAFQAIVNRHPCLRTIFTTIDGEPVQRIQEHVEVCFTEQIALSWNADSVNQYLLDEAHRPFDLEHGPLMHINLLTRSADEYIILVAIHHIVCDFWSLAIILKELEQFYNSERGEQTHKLEAQDYSYTDYVQWQQDMVNGARGEQLRTYWQEQLSGEFPLLNLPYDKARPVLPTSHAASQIITLDEQLTQALLSLSRSQSATLYMTLLAAFQVLLYRYTGQKEFLLGTPTSGRNLPEWASIVGYFVNPIILKATISEDSSFVQHLKQVQQAALAAFEHQDYPFVLLAEKLQMVRDLARPELLQVVFALQKSHIREKDGLAALALPGNTATPVRIGNLQLETLPLQQQAGPFELTLMIAEDDGKLVASLQYNTDLFNSDSISRLLENYRVLLEESVSHPDESISRLNLLTFAEQQQLDEWNRTESEYDSGILVHKRFEAQAEKRPQAVAVAGDKRKFTYRELNRLANRLAQRLRDQAVGAEIPVAICLDRSVEMIVAVLGILKAGGFYIPIDPLYPKERISFMLEDSGARVLITSHNLIEAMPETPAQIIELDAWENTEQENDHNPAITIQAKNLAYMIYTSGSTGLPKGVAVHHDGLTNLITWHQKAYDITYQDKATQIASPAFDASVWEIWPYLTAGASIHIPDTALRSSPLDLWNWLAHERITICFLPTPLAEAILAEDSLPEDLVLRAMLVGGDKLHSAPAKQLPFALVNHYGPTENSVVATSARVDSSFDAQAAPPIGRPIANTHTYILDSHFKPVPVGVAGEIYISGTGLARCYHKRPELTAERFVPDPFNSEPGARMYRTGDLGRFRQDGNIEFLGRIDFQVKINGFRIELGEIEAVLQSHPSIREAVVIAREVSTTRRYLAAYLVLAGNQEITATELRVYYKDKLPEYMIPGSFVILEQFPLTTNGKLDRSALPDPADMIGESERASILPESLTEEMLAGIWCQVLELKQVSPGDNFFQLGGHSLLAAQLVSRIRELFQIEMPLRSVFECPTIAELAQKVDQIMKSGREKQSPPLEKIERKGDIPLTSAQERLWFLYKFEPDNAAYNIPVAIRMSGLLHLDALERSLNEIIQRHEILRATFVSRQGRPVQIIAPLLRLHLKMTNLASLSEATRHFEVIRMAREEAHMPFNLAEGPLFRGSLLRLADQEHVLLLTLHHIVFDGWSARIFLDELKVLYEAYLTTMEPQLAQPEIQYADFAIWQKRLLENEALQSEMAYWKDKLSGTPPGLDLSTDHPRPAMQTFNGQIIPFEVSPKTKDALEALSNRQGVTLFMLLLAAFKLLLYRYTGQHDITVGTPIAGRNDIKTEKIIGLFANVLVLRTDLSGNPHFRELLARVRETSLGAFVNQNVPFERLVEEVYTGRDLSRTPLFQVMFSMLNTPVRQLELAGLSLEILDIPQMTAKFDLLLSVEEISDKLTFNLEYNTDLFNQSTVLGIVRHYQHLLEAIAADSDRYIKDLPLLDENERHQLLNLWNDTARDYSGISLIHEMFERQATDTSGAIAIQAGTQQLTYKELQDRSNQLAHYLRNLGVGSGILTAIFMERSVDMVVALLGVLKAGGAYVPLDPSYPSERLAFMLEDAQVPVVLTQQKLVQSVPYDRCKIICMDTDWHSIASESAEPLQTRTGTEEVAYVIYTSGSTGKPKGVQITHRSVVNFLHTMQESFCLTEQDILLAVTTLSFDIAVLELLLPITTGCRIELVSSEEASDGARLREKLTTSGATLMQATPATWRMLLDGGWQGSKNLKVICGGEALQMDLAAKLVQRSDSMWNLYGPTETTVWSLLWKVQLTDNLVLIGKPIANTQIYLLDGNLQPVPVGVPGHLYIGGDGLARGYLNRPELTADRFIPNPFGSKLGDRMYATGDVARFRTDGNIEFLGRIDNQVKLRGFRIELGEIESVLNQHPGLQNAIVVAHGATMSEKRLVAYAIGTDATPPTISELRNHLIAKLPEYMIPSTYVFLDQFPLTPNGKIDRKMLPAPDGIRQGVDVDYVAPRTPTEQVLAKIWQEVIGIDQVGVFDNFFQLGGHSLSATQIIAKLTEAFTIEIPLRTLFESPSIAGLAELVDAAKANQSETLTPAIVPRSREAYRVKRPNSMHKGEDIEAAKIR